MLFRSIQAAFNLVAARLQLQQTNAAFGVLDDIVTRPNADVGALLSVARAYVEIGQYARSEPALQRLVLLMPASPEIWFDLPTGGADFTCDLGAAGWDLRPGQDVAVGYVDPMGHRVINVFREGGYTVFLPLVTR